MVLTILLVPKCDEVPVMRFYVLPFRWVLPVLLILPIAACKAKQPSAVDTATLIKQAQSGDAKAQYELGRDYDRGQGVAKDEAEAARLYRKTADQGDADAQTRLGWDYDQGIGVTKDGAEAVRWYLKAAEQGDADAQTSLGWDYERGQGVPQDYAQAEAWYRKAAEQGDAFGQYNLGVDYERGQQGVPQDYAQADAWYRKAADQGLAPAQYNLGLLYYIGQGVPQDYAEAYFWEDLAASLKFDTYDGRPIYGEDENSTHDNAAKTRDEAATQLNRELLTKTQERARKWFEAHTSPAKAQ